MSDSSGGGAAVPRGSKGKLRPQPPREYICVVGGCCNTFNSWVSYAYKPGKPETAFIGGAPPRNRGEISTYINFTPERVDLDAIPEDQWRRHGWWRASYNELKELGWKATDVTTQTTTTHDIYWGNFITPAARIFNSDEPWPEPLRRPQPRPGDLVTFMVYAPSYEYRARIDWEASPYNPAHRDKYEAAKYWGTENEHHAPAESTGTMTPDEKRRKRQEAIERAKARAADLSRPLSDEDVNFYIMIRTTGDNTEEYIKKPTRPDSYLEYIYRELLQSVRTDGVLIKLLLFRRPQQLIDYIAKGHWSGAPWDTYSEARNWDEPSDEELANDDKDEDHNYAFSPPRPVKNDAYGRPLKWTLPWYPAWEKTPGVNRHAVKVARFDYIGHSDETTMMLQYGWGNAKGFWPDVDRASGVDLCLTWVEMFESFAHGVLAPDAFAMLWGCNLGTVTDENGADTNALAPWLADNLFHGGVVAADTRTTFEQVTTGSSKMPVPVDGKQWVYFKPKPRAP